MPSFGKKSREQLLTCDKRIQKLFQEVVKKFDCAIIQGHRTKEEQAARYAEGKSRVLDSKHNAVPSLAADVAPHPIDWNNLKTFYYFAGYVLAVADVLDIPIRWGGDWDQDNELDDQQFNDLVHFEIKE